MEPLPLYRVFAPIVFVAGLAALCAVRDIARFRTMLLGIAVLSGYGMLQDQVSARLCPEYFTKLHPPVPGVTDPTLLGIAWGFLGAWWGGAALGYAAGIAATIGTRPPLQVRELVRPMLVLMTVVATVTAVTGVNVAVHAELFGVSMDSNSAELVPPERRRAALVVACYHFSAYATAILGSIVLTVWISLERKRRELSRRELATAGDDNPTFLASSAPGSPPR
jgi:hypothetical protein